MSRPKQNTSPSSLSLPPSPIFFSHPLQPHQAPPRVRLQLRARDAHQARPELDQRLLLAQAARPVHADVIGADVHGKMERGVWKGGWRKVKKKTRLSGAPIDDPPHSLSLFFPVGERRPLTTRAPPPPTAPDGRLVRTPALPPDGFQRQGRRSADGRPVPQVHAQRRVHPERGQVQRAACHSW